MGAWAGSYDDTIDMQVVRVIWTVKEKKSGDTVVLSSSDNTSARSPLSGQ